MKVCSFISLYRSHSETLKEFKTCKNFEANTELISNRRTDLIVVTVDFTARCSN